MPEKYRLFSDVTKVTQSARLALRGTGLTNDDHTVVSCARLVPLLRDRKVTEHDVKVATLIELDSDTPRADIIHRLVSYLSYSSKEAVMAQVEKLLNE